MKNVVLLLLIAAFLSACAPWAQVGGPYTSAEHRFSVEIPEGWMKFNTDSYLMISRDGAFLQYVIVQLRPVARTFRHTHRRLNPAMLPQESAEVVIDELMSDPAVRNFRLIENAPAQIGTKGGFKLLFSYENLDGLKMKTLYYGFLQADRFYNLRYTAAARHYFAKDLESFQQILDSFQTF